MRPATTKVPLSGHLSLILVLVTSAAAEMFFFNFIASFLFQRQSIAPINQVRCPRMRASTRWRAQRPARSVACWHRRAQR